MERNENDQFERSKWASSDAQFLAHHLSPSCQRLVFRHIHPLLLMVENHNQNLLLRGHYWSWRQRIEAQIEKKRCKTAFLSCDRWKVAVKFTRQDWLTAEGVYTRMDTAIYLKSVERVIKCDGSVKMRLPFYIPKAEAGAKVPRQASSTHGNKESSADIFR